MEIRPFCSIFWKYLGNIRLLFLEILAKLFLASVWTCKWFFIFSLPIQSNTVVLANGYITTAVFILSRRYGSCDVFMSAAVALEGVWVVGTDCRAGQAEPVADGGLQSECRVEEVPPSARCSLPSLGLPME